MFKEDAKVYKIEVAFDSRSIIVSAVKKGKERRGHFEMSQHHESRSQTRFCSKEFAESNKSLANNICQTQRSILFPS